MLKAKLDKLRYIYKSVYNLYYLNKHLICLTLYIQVPFMANTHICYYIWYNNNLSKNKSLYLSNLIDAKKKKKTLNFK